MPLRSAAGAHVKPVHGKARIESGGAQTPNVAGAPGALEAMNHNEFAARLPRRMLRLDEHPNVRLRLHEAALNRRE
jgi:hypothetical protein